MNKKKIILLTILVLTIVFFRWFRLEEYINLNTLKTQKHLLLQLRDTYYLSFVFSYIVFYALSVTLSLPLAGLLSLAGGYLFGVFPGVFFILLGATLGAILSFLLARYLLGNFLQKKYANKLHKLNQELEKNGPFYLLFLRLVPIFPFFLINFLAGLTSLSLLQYTLTTFIGILPGSLVYSFAGQSLSSLNSLKDIFSLPLLLSLFALGFMSLLPIILKKLFKTKK